MITDKIKRLEELNNIKIYSVFDEEFSDFGKVIENYDFTEFFEYMKKTKIPASGNIYVALDPVLTEMKTAKLIENTVYGGMEIQVGYCNGMNTTYNGFEYHKCSEVNIALNDFLLVFGKKKMIVNNTYNNLDTYVFYVPKGTAIEMYQTTLHLSPIRISDEGFKDIVILLKGTNTPLSKDKIEFNENDTEKEILLYKNKWIICHKDREPLVKQGAHIGIIGDNVELKY